MQGVNENGETFVASKLFQLQPPTLPKIQPETLVDSGKNIVFLIIFIENGVVPAKYLEKSSFQLIFIFLP